MLQAATCSIRRQEADSAAAPAWTPPSLRLLLPQAVCPLSRWERTMWVTKPKSMQALVALWDLFFNDDAAHKSDGAMVAWYRHDCVVYLWQ